VNEQQEYLRLLTAEDIAVMLQLKVQTVYTMARRGELQKVKLSRKCLRFRADEIERFIERKAAKFMTNITASVPLSVTSVTRLTKQLGATIDGFVPIISKTSREELQVNGLPQSARKLIVARFDFSDSFTLVRGAPQNVNIPADVYRCEVVCRRWHEMVDGELGEE
jgi:excisionase family DNA binding protein